MIVNVHKYYNISFFKLVFRQTAVCDNWPETENLLIKRNKYNRKFKYIII